MQLINVIIPFSLCIRHRSALTPDRGLSDPPSLFCRYRKQCKSADPIVISQDVYPALLTCRDPSPSISPASHWQNERLKDVARVVSEVPTKLDTGRPSTCRWLPADLIPNDTFLLLRGATSTESVTTLWRAPLTKAVASLDSRPFQQIVQCVSTLSHTLKIGI